MKRKPAGGKGSNQYQTKGSSAVSAVASRSAVSALAGADTIDPRPLPIAATTAEFVRLTYQGVPALEIARRAGVHKRTVLRHLAAEGVEPVPTDPTPDNKFVPDDPDGMVRLYADGASLHEVGASYGVDAATAKRVLVELGVAVRPRPIPERPRREDLDVRLRTGSIAEVCAHYEVSSTTVLRWAADFGIDADSDAAPYRARNQSDLIVDRYEKGGSIEDIATEVGVPVRYIRDELGRLRLPVEGEPLTETLVAEVVAGGGSVDDIIARTGVSRASADQHIAAYRTRTRVPVRRGTHQ